MKHEEKMDVYAARPSLGYTSKTCRDQAHAILHAASAYRVFFCAITPGYRS
jgi:hypothetical protein